MNRLFSLVAISSIAAASAVQHPLQDGSQALINTKPLVSSEALEGHISSKNLLNRAKKLYEIAELGAAEYNHPTRVIGSAGRILLPFIPLLTTLLTHVAQDTLEHSITYTRLFPNLMTTTNCPISLSKLSLAMSSNHVLC